MKIKLKKIFRWLFYIFAFIVLVLGGIFIILQYWFPSSFLISKIEAYMKDNYNLGLRIEKLDFSLLSGITVEKFSFTDNDMPDSLFTLESFTLKYEVWPLLEKKLVVEKLIINAPRINVVRDENGKFNFDGIIEKFAGKDKPAEPELPEAPEPESKGEQFIIDLKNFEINDINVTYEDRSNESPMKAKLPLYSIKVSDVNFKDMENLKADVLISTGKKNELSYRDKDNSLKFIQDMKLTVSAVNENINIGFSHRISELEVFSPAANIEDPGDISLELKAYYNLKSDSLKIASFGFYVEDMFKTEMSGFVSKLSSSQTAEILLSELSADVGSITSYVSKHGLADLQGAEIKKSFFNLKNVKIRHIVADNYTDVSGSMDFNAVDILYKQNEISAAVKYLIVKSGFVLTLKDSRLLSGSVDLGMELESVNADVSGAKYSTGRQSLSVVPVLKSDFMPSAVKVNYDIADIAGGAITIALDAAFDLTDTSVPALIKNTSAEITVKADRLHPHILAPSAPENLFVSFGEKLSFKNGIAENEFDLQTEYESGEQSYYSAADGINVSTYLKADMNGHPKERYKLIALTAKINDMLYAEMKDLSVDLKTMEVSAGKFEVKADLDELLKTGKATGLEAIKNTRLYNGSLNISAEGGGNLNKQESTSELRLDLNIDSLFHDEISISRGVKVNQTVNLLTKDVSLIGETSVSGADFSGMLKEMGIAGEVKIENNFRLTETGELRILKLAMAVPPLETEFGVKGKADIKDSLYAFDVELSHKIGLKKNYPIVKGIDNIKGAVSGSTRLAGNLKTVTVSHTQTLEGIGLVLDLDSLGNKVRIAGLSASIPFNARLDLKELKLLDFNRFGKIKEFDFLSYTSMRGQHKLNGIPVSNFRIDTVAVSHQLFRNNIKNIELDIYFDDNKFCLNRFYYELFDGNAAGYLRLDLGEGGFGDITSKADLDMGLTMTGLNTYYLTRTKTKRSPSTELNVIMKIKSKGLDFINEPDLNGEINLSKLSGDDAKYLLEFLNKNTGDQTAGMVRNMLNAFPGIKVDLFSFTIKNNFIYTLIKLKKPWYLVYFPLAEQISLSKQSLKFYLDKYVKEDL
jgi:hypothetical protein